MSCTLVPLRVMVVGLIAALVMLGAALAPTAVLAAGYWHFEGIDLSPKQSVLDETARGMRAISRVWEAWVSGGFQAEAAGERRLRASATRIEELRGRIRKARLEGENTAASEELLKLVENAHEWFVEDLALRS